MVDDACLLVSELVTNAYQHARTIVTVAIICDHTHVSVAVHDDGPTVPPKPRTATVMDERGRGLPLVAALASGFGIRPGTDGKTIWFRCP